MSTTKNGITIQKVMESIIITFPLCPDVIIPLSLEDAEELGNALIKNSINEFKKQDTTILRKKSTYLTIYTDGACSGNPGPGAAAYIIKEDANIIAKDVEVFNNTTTNIRMELKAVINALTYIVEEGYSNSEITLYSDSKYVVDGITNWIKSWKDNNWRRVKNKPISNLNYWKCLDNINEQLSIDWQWVKGHSGHPDNELVDNMAQDACPSN